MEHTFSSHSFLFRRIRRHKSSYTDGRDGSSMHFIGFLRKGTAKLVGNGVTIPIAAGEFFYIPEGEPYQSYWYGDKEGEVEFDSLGFHHFPEAEFQKFAMQKIPASDTLLTLLEQIPRNRQITSEALGSFYTLLAAVLPGMARVERGNRSLVLNLAENYLWEHPQAKMSQVAQYCGVSESGLYGAFSRAGKQTPNDLRQQILAQKATELLQTTDMSVEDISARLGFSSASYFRKVLGKHTGKTPRELRKQRNW